MLWNKNTKEQLQYALGALLVLGEFSLIIGVLAVWFKGPGTTDPNVINLVYGLALGFHSAFMLVVGYFYGSSKGSADKSDAMSYKQEQPQP